jgi:hypothetical protein
MPNTTMKAFEIVLGERPETDEAPAAAHPMNESEMAGYIGTYSQDRDESLRILENDGMLFVEVSNQLLNMTDVQIPLEMMDDGRLAYVVKLPGTSLPERGYIGAAKGEDGRIEYLTHGWRAYRRV